MYEIAIKILKKVIPNSGEIFLKKGKEEQQDFMNKLYKKINSKNLIERSFSQYKCQMFLQDNIVKNILLNVISLPLIIIFIIFSLIYKDDKDKKNNKNKYAISFAYEYSIPIELIDEFTIKSGYKSFKLKIEDIKWIFKNIIVKYPFSYYFILKNLVKIALYRYNIEKYNLSAIIVNSEYAFTSSILTAYCRYNNIEHINCMHGEKLFCIRDSFFEFDRFYIWDEYYKTLLTSLYASKKQFIIYNLEFKLDKNKNEIKNTVKYYLQNESEEELKIIVDNLEKLKEKNYNVIFRPHPRYTDTKLIKNITDKIEIEDNDLDIIDSINEAEYIISKFSTVLYQAHCLNKKIVIDDISNNVLYKNLSEYDYIMLNKEHITLSELIRL